MRVGDMVEVTDPGMTYSTYYDWIRLYAPEYESRWAKYQTPDRHIRCHIVAQGPHETERDAILCLVQTANHQVYIMHTRGLRFVRHNCHYARTHFFFEQGVRI